MTAERCVGRDGFGRIRYSSPAKARKAAGRSRRFAGRLRIYRCPRCGDWHITSKPERGQR